MATGGGGSGSLLRALGVEITVTADSGGVPAWADQPEETRQKLIEIAQRVFKDTLDGVVRFEHEHLSPQTYSQSLVVFATPSPAHKDIVLGGVRELAARIQEDIATRFGRMGARPTVQVIPDRSFTSGSAPPTPPPVQPAQPAQQPQQGYGSGYGSGYSSQGAMTTMASSGSGEGGGPVPMVLVPAFGQRQEPPPPPPPPPEDKPIIPNRVYPLLFASAIAGISICANAFLGLRYMAIRSENVEVRETLTKERTDSQKRFAELDKNYTILQERHRVFETEERSGADLRAQSERLRAQIDTLANSTGIRVQELGPIPELRTAWTSSLRSYITRQEAEFARLEAEARRRGRAAEIAAARQVRREAPSVPPSSQGGGNPPN